MIATMMIAAALAQDPGTVRASRAAFDDCLEARVEAARDGGQSPADFRAAIRTACAAEAAALRTALIAYDLSTGQGADDAATWAQEDIDDSREAAARRLER
ncbi:hypothetical protein [Sphingomicrobium astaxanthinifaciens]|uniref:hypothetical protein n=1 Tax=Sphingomicrobium astaxanthinifaciens TaxID=1227949 RepID=UPI001FCA6B9E|nr:hypothetical protein [Sphingomicrobium astaxanthinifaciens]MCJ7421586.1 hypothetical protein [Sphingomicrobium astaxanthinifaciens]